MTSFPMRVFLARALSQLRCLHVPLRYSHSAALLQGKLLGTISNTPSLNRLLCYRWFHQPSVAWAAQKSDRTQVKKKDLVSAAKDKRAQMVKVIGDVDSEEQLMTKAQAEALATERSLRLVRVDAGAGQTQPTYQLMTGKELAAERNRLQEIKRANKKKEPKALRVTSRITKHDLETKTKKVVEWLQKGQDIKLTIKNSTPDNDKAALDVFKYMTDKTQGLATVSHSQKSASELIYVLKPTDAEPPKAAKTKPFTTAELKEMREKDAQT